MADEEPQTGSSVTQLIVTLRRTSFAEASARTRKVLDDKLDADGTRALRRQFDGETRVQPPRHKGHSEGFDVIESLERDGLLLDVNPLVLPVAGRRSYAQSLPLGAGRLPTAAAESFSSSVGRPSDHILSGTMLLSFADSDKASAALKRLSQATGAVERVEHVPVRRLIASAPGAVGPAWHLQRIGVDRARQQPGYLDGSTVTIATFDTGIDAGHPMLQPGILKYTSSYPGAPPSSPRDLGAHGSFVAGVIGARGGVDGVGRSRFRVLKVFHDSIDAYQPMHRTDGSLFYAAQSAPDEGMYVLALGYCLDENIPVLNFSLGYDSLHSREAEIFAGYARNGQAVIAATGNGGVGAPTLFPAGHDGAIAVGALDRDDRAANFSSSARFMHISAPGVDIVGTMPTYAGATEFEPDAANPNKPGAPIPWSTTTGTMSGTSAATPQVAAAAALWIARNGRDLNLMRDRLAATARKVPEMGGAVRTDRHGFGCLDVAALLA